MYLPAKLKFKYIALGCILLVFLFSPFHNFITHIVIFFSRQHIINQETASRRIEELQKQNILLVFKVRQSQFLQQENERLKQALRLQEEKRCTLVATRVIVFDPSVWRRIAVINSGRNHGMREGLIAVDTRGFLVGKIIEVQKNYSRLMLIDDPDFSLPVLIGNDTVGMLKGSLDGAKVMYIDNTEHVNEHDKIWCRIAYVNFPIYIGEIKTTRKSKNSLFWDIEVNLLSENPLLYDIFIIK
ncbi:MAG: rod shape-determining protein MreC [Candidatus Omnitrophota bacterium]